MLTRGVGVGLGLGDGVGVGDGVGDGDGDGDGVAAESCGTFQNPPFNVNAPPLCAFEALTSPRVPSRP